MKEIMNNKIKVTLVAHEFGLFPGRGGIATYLYHLSKGFLEIYNDVEVHVIAIACDQNCDLKKRNNFHLHQLVTGGIETQGNEVLEKLKEIKPDVVEVAEAFGFCLESILYRNCFGKELKKTKFVVINHTATKECYEWSLKLPIKMAPRDIQTMYLREKAQMYMADYNTFPAEFLTNYVTKNYRIKNSKILRYTYCGRPSKKEEIIKKLQDKIDWEFYKNKFVVSYVSRLEGRKNQQQLVDAFIKFVKETSADALLILAGNSLIDSVTGQDERMKIYASIPSKYRRFIQIFDFVDDKMIEKLCAVTDLTVMTSVFENFPFAMIENVYRGIPILTSKYNGCSDIMGDNKNKMSFDPFKENDLTIKIKGFYELSEQERIEIGKEQYRNMEKMCDPEYSIKEKMEFFSEVTVTGSSKMNSNKIKKLSQKDLDLIISETPGEEFDLILCQNRIKKFTDKKLYEAYGIMIDQCDNNDLIVFGHNINYDVDFIEALRSQRIIYLKGVVIKETHKEKKYLDVIIEELELRKNNYTYIPILDNFYEKMVDHKEKDNDGSFLPIISKILYKRKLNMEELYNEK
jgi:glycosyltransferase involved in cell wall biosynthesis